MGKLIILSGPSCVGKGPMTSAMKAYCKANGKTLVKHVLYNDRPLRLGEQDGVTYHFRSTVELNSLYNSNQDRYHLYPVNAKKTNYQMLDKYMLIDELNKNDVVLLEILITEVNVPIALCNSIPFIAEQIFIEPFSDADYFDMGCVTQASKDAAVVAAMLNKLINRSTEGRDDQLKRALRVPKEIQDAKASGAKFITNHFGEDNSRLWGLLEEFVSHPGSCEIFETFMEFRKLIQ